MLSIVMKNLSNISKYTVTELNKSIKNIIEGTIGLVNVTGEISQLKKHSSGHIYFTLKDEESVISSICWRSTVPLLENQITEGASVQIKGRVTTYSPQSKYQLIVEQVEYIGEGAILKILEERKKKLLKEGLFNQDYKKTIPQFPQVVGIITSETGAVLKDIIHRVEDRFPSKLILFPAKVQGEKCVEEICKGISFFNNLSTQENKEKVDVIILARGGGSLEDLMSFNDEILVRAIFKSRIPIVSAVGHETDITLCDFVADLRSPTPTAAAEMIFPDRKEILARINEKFLQMNKTFLKNFDEKNKSLDYIFSRLPKFDIILNKYFQHLDLFGQKIDGLLNQTFLEKKMRYLDVVKKLNSDSFLNTVKVLRNNLLLSHKNLLKELQGFIEKKKMNFNSKKKELSLISHRKTLKRGFALVKTKDKIVSDATKISNEEELEIEFFKNKINVRKI